MLKNKIIILFLCFFPGTGTLLSQNNIVVENTNIINTAVFYGAINTLTSTSSESKPVNILTGDKTIEFVAGNQVNLKPGFHATAQVGGCFKAFISPSFTVSSNPFPLESNDFKIGMFGYKSIFNCDWTCDPWDNICKPISTTTTLINGQVANSSQLNVLKEDGFNIVQNYNINSSSPTFLKEMITLIKNNSMQLLIETPGYFKPNSTGFSGINVYDANIGSPDIPSHSCLSRPNYDYNMKYIYPDINFRSTLWGSKMGEEFSHGQPQNITDTYQNWNDCNTNNVRHVDCPAENVAQAISHFKSNLSNQGVTEHKFLYMDSYHVNGIRINGVIDDDGGPHSIQSNSAASNTIDHYCQVKCSYNSIDPNCNASHSYYPFINTGTGTVQGYSQPQDYLKSLNHGE